MCTTSCITCTQTWLSDSLWYRIEMLLKWNLKLLSGWPVSKKQMIEQTNRRWRCASFVQLKICMNQYAFTALYYAAHHWNLNEYVNNVLPTRVCHLTASSRGHIKPDPWYLLQCHEYLLELYITTSKHLLD